MAFQAPITIKKALEQIERHDYALPAIQREFVWSREQISMLFDSLLRGYPIGAFLFWEVNPENSKRFVFYDFIRHYHERKGRHCPTLDLAQPRSLVAILDGQQRLTALNIALRGSHAEKLPRLWHNNPQAYPKKELYLDLCHSGDEDELGYVYRFEFLTSEERAQTNGSHWYRVPDILELPDGPPLFQYLQQNGLADHAEAFNTLWKLHQTVHHSEVISYYEEDDQDLDKVLHIFIRLNSQGTPLSHSDLLLSIATAQWNDLDARETIYSLVDDLNQEGQGFNVSKDLVLKAGLVMTDASDIRFRVANFNQTNMAKLEAEWSRIDKALRLAVRLLSSFGFSDRTLAAYSVLIPVADYLYQRGAEDAYVTSQAFAEDRVRIRTWVIRSLLKAGIWGSGLDTLLARLRRVLRAQPKDAFPTEQLESAMLLAGKSLRFQVEEIEDLVETPYANKKTFPILALLYVGANVHQTSFHEDHIFPRSLFTSAKLLKAGVPAARVQDFVDRRDLLPNLQLLPGTANVAKQASLPLAWWERVEPEEEKRDALLAYHDMHQLPAGIDQFDCFYATRRERMLGKLRTLLGVTDEVASDPVETSAPDDVPLGTP